MNAQTKEMIDLPSEWDISTKISFLQRRVIVYSIQYYEFNATVISDAQYDAIARQLESLMRSATPEELERSTYWYCMYNFTAATGFDIYSRLDPKDKEYLEHIADIVLDDYRHMMGLKG